MSDALPPIPAKRYFTIGEVAELCGVKQHVLRHWEQEFSQLRPMKRSGNRRYYQHHEVLMVRRIRELLHEQGYTIPGAQPPAGGRAVRQPTGSIPASAVSATAPGCSWPGLAPGQAGTAGDQKNSDRRMKSRVFCLQ